MREKATASEWIRVKESEIHGKGIYAKKKIPRGTMIIEYVGDIITKVDSDLRADDAFEEAKKDKTKGEVYIFELNDEYDIDGNVERNTARLINHSCEPNCETTGDDEHIWIEAIKDIGEGEELSYDYCYDLDCYEDNPCKCGSDNCVGFIVDEKVRGKLKKKLGNVKK